MRAFHVDKESLSLPISAVFRITKNLLQILSEKSDGNAGGFLYESNRHCPPDRGLCYYIPKVKNR